MSYREYQRELGLEVVELRPGVTHQDFSVHEGDACWFATLYLKDGAPLLLQLYVWEGELEAVWRRVGHGVPDGVESRGNGHYSAAWKLR